MLIFFFSLSYLWEYITVTSSLGYTISGENASTFHSDVKSNDMSKTFYRRHVHFKLTNYKGSKVKVSENQSVVMFESKCNNY